MIEVYHHNGNGQFKCWYTWVLSSRYSTASLWQKNYSIQIIARRKKLLYHKQIKIKVAWDYYELPEYLQKIIEFTSVQEIQFYVQRFKFIFAYFNNLTEYYYL